MLSIDEASVLTGFVCSVENRGRGGASVHLSLLYPQGI